MTSKEWLGSLSLLCGILGYASYFWSLMTRKISPHALSWIVWGASTAIVCCAQLSDGAGSGAWATAFSSMMCFIIAGLALYRGKNVITRTDCFAFAGALFAIPIWYLTKNPLWSVILISSIDTLGHYPTFRKSYAKPYEETSGIYIITALKYMVALFALNNVTWITALYPAVVASSCIGFVILLVWRRKVIQQTL